jgi:hypothetical protein
MEKSQAFVNNAVGTNPIFGAIFACVDMARARDPGLEGRYHHIGIGEGVKVCLHCYEEACAGIKQIVNAPECATDLITIIAKCGNYATFGTTGNEKFRRDAAIFSGHFC